MSVVEKGLTPIMPAAHRGDIKIVDVLVLHEEFEENGLSKPLDTYQNEALCMADACGQTEVASVLLDYGADKDAQAENALTPLVWEAYIDARTNKRATALHYAARNGRFQVARLLFDSGADVDALGDKLNTLLMEAVPEEHLKVGDLLQSSGARIYMPDKHERTALHLAVEREELAVVKLLLDSGDDVWVYTADNQGFTPLMTAAWWE
ncbi:Ankyrin repeat domain-containing protein 17 [Phytophthora nicotianae]|uniref:Ankyrin repeat domain-containing protein 17 n=1 Tax=Phytophthora nicotianae TaxID=4792 RepID=A0A0W8B096_PHYNI|nr:Ankyrin repeat domain-containing protein 17 [Phytophthora nicotianae]